MIPLCAWTVFYLVLLAASLFPKCKPPVLPADYASPPWSSAEGYPVLAGWPSTAPLPECRFPGPRRPRSPKPPSGSTHHGCFCTSARGRRAGRGAAKHMPVLKTLNGLWDAGNQNLHGAAQQVGGGPRCQQWHMVRDPGTEEGCALFSAGLAELWRCRPPPLWTHSPVSGAGEKSSGQPPIPIPFLLCPRHHFPPLAHTAEDRAVEPPLGGKGRLRDAPGESSRLHTHTGTPGPNHSRDAEHKQCPPCYHPEGTKC